MVKQFVSPVRVYKYPFELIAVAYQTRFPYNARVPIMLKSQLMEEETSEDGTKEKKVRRCTLKIDMPYLMKKISGIESALFKTTTELDWVARRFVISSANETFSSRIRIVETCTFSVHPENDEWTCYEQDCSIEMISVWGFEQQGEKLGIDRYIARLPKTKEVMELFVEDVRARGLHVPKPYGTRHPSTPLPTVQAVSAGAEAEADAAAEAAAALVPTSATSTPSRSTPSRSIGSTSSHRRTSSQGGAGEAVAMAKMATVGAPSPSSSTAAMATEAAACTSSSSLLSGSGDVVGMVASAASCSTSATSSEERVRLLRRRDSSGIDSDKLEEEYIQRFLGELSPYQESNLIQLKQKLSNIAKEKMPNDAVLLRFLRARDFSIEKARDMVTRHVAWRKQYQVDRLVDTWEPSDTIRQYYAGGWHHFDKRGHPVYLMRLGQVDIKGLLKAVGETDVLKQVVAHEEEGLRRCERATRSSDKAISTVTLICDLDGLSLRHLWRPGIRAADRIIQILLNNYPETMGRLVFVRAPRIFPVLWAIVSPFLDEATREKFVFMVGHDYEEKTGGLTDYIEPENIPDFLGGPCKSTVPAGGIVPKEFHRKGDDEFVDSDGGGCALDTAYQTATVTKDRPCEVILPVDCDSVLFWDFDISRGKVYFSVLRVNSGGDTDDAEPPNEEASNPASPTHSLTHLHAQPQAHSRANARAHAHAQAHAHAHASSVSTLNTHHSFSETGSYDSRQELNEALHVVGPELYHDNDSVQGTYTVNRSGIYLLRWELCQPTSFAAGAVPGAATSAVTTSTAVTSPSQAATTAASSPTMASAAASSSMSTSSLSDRFWRKAHLMYYLEVLQPDRFKGSVSSLESWQSAVSTLSMDPSLVEEVHPLAVHIPPALSMHHPQAAAGARTTSRRKSSSSGATKVRATARAASSTAPQPSQSSAAGKAATSSTIAPPSGTPVVRKKQMWSDV